MRCFVGGKRCFAGGGDSIVLAGDNSTIRCTLCYFLQKTNYHLLYFSRSKRIFACSKRYKCLMRRWLLLCSALLLTLGVSAQTSGEDFVRNFYEKYLSEEPSAQVEALKMLTPRLQAKVARLRAEMNGDPFTRTEGITPEMRKTLRVMPAENGWFVASFTTHFEDELLTETTKIPVFPEQIEGRWQLARIAAPWEEDLEQLYSPLDAPKAVDESSPTKFVETFYQNYLTPFAAMDVDAPERAKQLREKYLTQPLLKVFNDKAQAGEEPVINRYDWILGGYDFDRSALASLSVTPISDQEVRVRFLKAGDIEFVYTIKVEKNAEGYRIADINTTSDEEVPAVDDEPTI